MKYNEISHFSHPQHKLKYDYTEIPFKCDGCKEVGIGSNYKCSTCDYDLHVHCATLLASITHPFYTKCSFQFMARPPGTTPRYCNACEKDISGFMYHCKSCGFDLHPCCAKLPMMLDDGEVKLYLYRKVSSACHRCGRKGRSWSYRSSCKKYNLHVACVKEMLVESWHDIYFGVGRGVINNNNHNYGNNTCNHNNNSSYSSNYRKLETRIPSLKGTLQSHHRKSKGKVKKCCEMAGLAMQFVISAVLGDPTTLIAGVVVDSTAPAATTVKLILLDGELKEFSCPIKVSLLLPPNSNCKSFICDADKMDFDEYVSAMSGEQELRQGQLYFELPTSWLTQRLEAEDMASLAVKASEALTQSNNSGGVKCGCCMKRVDPYTYLGEGEMIQNLGGGGVGGGGKERKLNRSLSVIIEG